MNEHDHEHHHHTHARGAGVDTPVPPVRATGGGAPVVPAEPPAGTIYTCPMHPQVRQPAPGNCPICGMTLEPELPSLE